MVIIMRIITLCILLPFLLAGCAGLTGSSLDATQIALAYYNQDRTYQPVEISGIQNFTLSAAEGQTITLKLVSQLEPLSVYPRDPSALAQFMDGLFKVGTVVGSTIVGYELVDGLSSSPKTVDPIIVEVPAAN